MEEKSIEGGLGEELGIEGGFCKGIRMVVKGKTPGFSKDSF